MLVLGKDVIRLIFSLLEDKELSRVSCVCKILFSIAQGVAKRRCKLNSKKHLYYLLEGYFSLKAFSKTFSSFLFFLNSIKSTHSLPTCPKILISDGKANISHQIFPIKISPNLFPRALNTKRFFYMEITFLSLFTKTASFGLEKDVISNTLPGLINTYAKQEVSIGYFQTGKMIANNEYSPFRSSPKYSYRAGDTIGMGVDYDRRIVFFTKNGESPGKVCDIPKSEYQEYWTPCIGFVFHVGGSAEMKVNCGEEPFVFNAKIYLAGSAGFLKRTDPQAVICSKLK